MSQQIVRYIIILIKEGCLIDMLKDNIRSFRKQKGLSQEELSVKLNVVRQTISKWEQGLSVPDSAMLVSISKVLEIPVNTLLGETELESKEDELQIVTQKLEDIKFQLTQKQQLNRIKLKRMLIVLLIILITIFLILLLLKSPYLNWDYNNPEKAVIGVIFHAFEWLFIRVVPLAMVSLIIGIIFMQNMNKN